MESLDFQINRLKMVKLEEEKNRFADIFLDMQRCKQLNSLKLKLRLSISQVNTRRSEIICKLYGHKNTKM